jgi:hypothetical protein
MKFKYNKALGSIYVILVLTAIVIYAFNWQISHMPIPPLGTVNKTELKTFSDPNGLFEFKYAKNYVLGTAEGSGSQNYLGKFGQTEAVIILPDSLFPKTNFGESYVTVARNSQITGNNSDDCKKYENGGSSVNTNKSETVNGINFDKAEFNGAAAGNFYETRLYRVFHSGICFEISLTLHTSNIGNFPNGAVVEVNKNTAWGKLMQVFNTFKFTPSTNPPVSSNPPGISQNGILSGHVSIGPICPVEQIDNPCLPTPEMYRMRKVVVTDLNNSQIAEESLDGAGNYSVELAAGDYLATVAPAGLVKLPAQNVNIAAGKTTTLNFSIDTGIR